MSQQPQSLSQSSPPSPSPQPVPAAGADLQTRLEASGGARCPKCNKPGSAFLSASPPRGRSGATCFACELQWLWCFSHQAWSIRPLDSAELRMGCEKCTQEFGAGRRH